MVLERFIGKAIRVWSMDAPTGEVVTFAQLYDPKEENQPPEKIYDHLYIDGGSSKLLDVRGNNLERYFTHPRSRRNCWSLPLPNSSFAT